MNLWIWGKVTPLWSNDECAKIEESNDENVSSRNDTPMFERSKEVKTEH